MTSIIYVRLSDVKPWLRNSTVYRGYIEDEEEIEEENPKAVPIEERYYCENPIYNTWQETSKTLQVCNFWDVDFIPVEVIMFIFNCTKREDIENIIDNNRYYKSKIVNIRTLKIFSMSNDYIDYKNISKLISIICLNLIAIPNN